MRAILSGIIIVAVFSCHQRDKQCTAQITRGNLRYDFCFADLSAKYLETGDPYYLNRIAKLPATAHLVSHASYFNNDIPKSPKIELVRYLLSPIEEKKEILTHFKKNLLYAKEQIAGQDLPQQECLKYLPDNFEYSGNLFFTFGYDLGVVFSNNASVNLAHPHYLEHQHEIKYYAIHELHHAGFVALKNNMMPSLNITKYREMAELIEYYTHLEGMGTYASLALRKKENAMDTDDDYIALADSALMEEYEKEYFRIYYHFKNDPQREIEDNDWEMISVLSDDKRLWYRVGAYIAQTIDEKLDRKKLVDLISEPSENFLNTYLDIRTDTVSGKR